MNLAFHYTPVTTAVIPLKNRGHEPTGKTMLSPVGIPPNLPVPPDNDLVAATDRAVMVPPGTAGASQWQVGSFLSATVRYQNDELFFRIGDQFFSSRPIPGLLENSRMTLQVARDQSGAMMLVPMLPLAGRALPRIGGTPSARSSAQILLEASGGTRAMMAPATATPASYPAAVQNLARSLVLPRSLADYVVRSREASATAFAAEAGDEVATISRGLAGWVQTITVAFAQSGLFMEARLRDRKPVSNLDLKKQLLEQIERGSASAQSEEAWAALDDLVALQSAATAAQQAGGACYSFMLPSPDGAGAWWVTLQQDPRQVREDESNKNHQEDERQPPWRIRITGVSLPMGDIDIRIEQVGRYGIGVTMLTEDPARAAHWEASRGELERRLQGAGLELARWNVIDARVEQPPSRGEPGQLRTIRI